MRVAKWGNSLAIRLPASVVEVLNLQEGDDVQILAEDSRTLALSRSPSRDELLQRLRAFRGKLPADFRLDRDQANER